MGTLLNDRYQFLGNQNYVYMSQASIAHRDMFLSTIDDEAGYLRQNCYVCGGTNFRRIGEIDRYGFYYPTAICGGCGNVQQEEYYDAEALKLFYSKYYRSIYGDSDPRTRFDIQRKIHGTDIFNFTRKYVQPSKVLEVGCGAGGILSRFADVGCNVLGLDYDEKFLDQARENNIPVLCGSIERLQKRDKFDLIILSHVLEHIVSPSIFLDRLAGHLADKGVLYIEVPSLDHVKHGGFQYDLLTYWQNAHTIHFTTKSLTLLCKKSGLVPLKTTEFIHSCWKKGSGSNEITMDEMKDSFEHTNSLLKDIENSRNSLKYYKVRVRDLASKILSLTKIKPLFRPIYRKLKGYS